MKYSMFSRFRTVGKKPVTTKLPSQKAPNKKRSIYGTYSKRKIS
jgi:hypothetical protein